MFSAPPLPESDTIIMVADAPATTPGAGQKAVVPGLDPAIVERARKDLCGFRNGADGKARYIPAGGHPAKAQSRDALYQALAAENPRRLRPGKIPQESISPLLSNLQTKMLWRHRCRLHRQFKNLSPCPFIET